MPDRVVIVGGGLAGLAAAQALAERGYAVTLLESRPRFGGRASSFVDAATGEAIDNCQHVVLGCCTNFFAFCRTLGIDGCFERDERLTFIGPGGTASDLAASALPAPLHLLPAFARMPFLSWGEKWRLALALRTLARTRPVDQSAPDAGTRDKESFLDWLKRHGQSPAAIERFWHVVLVSALSETLDRIDVSHARKVFVDAFLRNRQGWEVWLPTVPLDELYGRALAGWFERHGVVARLGAGVKRVLAGERRDERGQESGVRSQKTCRTTGVELRSGEIIEADHVILAVPQYLVHDLLPDEWRASPEFLALARLETAPISSVHLWFDRAITDLKHATLVGRQSQWLFNRSAIQGGGERGQEAGVRGQETADGHYYQVVISASRDVTARDSDETIRSVVAELADVWPAARDAKLVHSRLVTEHRAVVSMRPGVETHRPGQQTSIVNLYLAGDWTRTGWPGTMEGAIRSGYMAAECVLRNGGRDERIVQPDLPTAPLAKLLFGV